MQHCSTEILEIRHGLARPLPHCAGKFQSAAFDYDIYVITVSAKETIPNVTSYDKSSY